MTILNIMLGKRRGGLEQAGLDYAEAMAHAGIPAITIHSPDAWIAQELAHKNLTSHALPNLGTWDVFAAFQLRRFAHSVGATAAITHGNRAQGVARRALARRIPLAAVAHNYRGRAFTQADAIFCITQDVSTHWQQHGVAKERLFFLPNMVRLPADQSRPAFRTPPVIGSLGRFAPVKGYDILIEALGILKQRNIHFHTVLGGDGDEAATLKSLAQKHQVADHITFPGWVEDKAAFFQGLDVFVLSSRREPFGIVVIEAMAHRVPVVSTAVEGPREIATHGVEALLTTPNDPLAMADALQTLLSNEAQARALADAAYRKVTTEYTIEAMGARLKDALSHLTSPR